jgi:VanZ family protein
VRRILLLIVALIVYGSLYPWNFQWYALPGNPLALVFGSWPHYANRYLFRDLAVNMVLYVPLGLFGFLALGHRRSRALRSAIALGLALVLSTGIEVLQLFDAGRYSSGFDVLCNVAGAAVGAGLAIALDGSMSRALAGSRWLARLRVSGPLLLLSCWIAYQLFPLMPELSRTRLHHKISLLVSTGSFPLTEFLLWFACWMAAARLLESLLEPEHTLGALAILMLAIPAKLLIASRTVTWPELVAAVFALIAWKQIQGHPRRTAGIAWMLGISLLVSGLAPFHVAHRAMEFWWVPFRASLAGDWISGLPTILRKSYVYGAVIWLLGQIGFSRALAAAGIVLLLTLLEAAQIYLPPHVPEITDPLLALLMTVFLALADLHHE